MASPRDTSQVASQPQRDTYSQSSRTLGRSVVAASEADSSEMGSTRDATLQAPEMLQKKIERLEKKMKATDQRCSDAEAELFKCQGENFSLHKKLREAESEAEQERESLELEVTQLKARQPTEDSSYITQLTAGNKFLQERTKETYGRALLSRQRRDFIDDCSTEEVFKALGQNNDAIAIFQETNRQHNDSIGQNNDEIAMLQEANSHLVYDFLHRREEKREDDKSADEALEEEVGQAFSNYISEGHPESQSPSLAATPYRSMWDSKNPKFQGTLEESREPPSVSSRKTEPNRPARAKGVPEMTALDLELPAKEETGIIPEAPPQDKIKMEETTEPAKVTSRPRGSETTLQAGPQPAPVSVDQTIIQKAKEAEAPQQGPAYLWLAQVLEKERLKQESKNLASTEKPRAAYSEVAKTETPPVKPTTGIASSSKTVLKPGMISKVKLPPRTPDLPEATTTPPGPSITGGKTEMPLRGKEQHKGDSKPSDSNPVSQAISEPPRYHSLPDKFKGSYRPEFDPDQDTQANPEDYRDEGQAGGAKGHVEDSTQAPKAPIGTGVSTAGIPATSGAGRGNANNQPRGGQQNRGHKGGGNYRGNNPRGTRGS